MIRARTVAALLLVLVWMAGDCAAGTFEISDIYYEVQPSSEIDDKSNVMVGAKARYVGTVDSNDHSWAIESKLFSGGQVYTNTPYSGTGVYQGMVIHCNASQHGAFKELNHCTPMGNDMAYYGTAVVAIYHQYDPETDTDMGSTEYLTCSQPPPEGGQDDDVPSEPGGGEVGCSCVNCGCSPILVNLDRGGFDLTSLVEPVSFDMDADGQPDHLSWTVPGSGDAWLVLDRNGNGTIDSGRELFGNFTPQPPNAEPNGYAALAVFDGLEEGGNLDGRIDADDAVFGRLRLWTDENRDGLSQAWELRSLVASGVRSLDLGYVSASRHDEHGNEFRYSSLVRLEGSTTQAADVFLLVDE